MATVNKIENVDRLIAKLKAKYAHVGDPNPAVAVGYAAAYAIYVHENVEMKWKGQPRHKPHKGSYWDPPGRGQAKFLEQPARELSPEFRRIIMEAVSKGASLGRALMLAGMRLLRESQKLVPVDTGNLKASAFIVEEHR